MSRSDGPAPGAQRSVAELLAAYGADASRPASRPASSSPRSGGRAASRASRDAVADAWQADGGRPAADAAPAPRGPAAPAPVPPPAGRPASYPAVPHAPGPPAPGGWAPGPRAAGPSAPAPSAPGQYAGTPYPPAARPPSPMSPPHRPAPAGPGRGAAAAPPGRVPGPSLGARPAPVPAGAPEARTASDGGPATAAAPLPFADDDLDADPDTAGPDDALDGNAADRRDGPPRSGLPTAPAARRSPTLRGVADPVDDLDDRPADEFSDIDAAYDAVWPDAHPDDLDDDGYGAPDEEAHAPSGVREWAVVGVQLVLGALLGALLWVVFSYLWQSLPVVALVLALVATTGLVFGVRALRRSDDLQTTVLAVVVGLVVTVSPAAFWLYAR